MLTQEQKATIEEIRIRHDYTHKTYENELTGELGGIAHDDRADLLNILDSLPKEQPSEELTQLRAANEILQKQLNAAILLGQAAVSLHPRQYTKDELRAAFALQFNGAAVRNGRFESIPLEDDFSEWLDCARFLGALKDEK